MCGIVLIYSAFFIMLYDKVFDEIKIYFLKVIKIFNKHSTVVLGSLSEAVLHFSFKFRFKLFRVNCC